MTPRDYSYTAQQLGNCKLNLLRKFAQAEQAAMDYLRKHGRLMPREWSEY